MHGSPASPDPITTTVCCFSGSGLSVMAGDTPQLMYPSLSRKRQADKASCLCLGCMRAAAASSLRYCVTSLRHRARM